MKLARHYQTLFKKGWCEIRVALARYLGGSTARVTQVLKSLEAEQVIR